MREGIIQRQRWNEYVRYLIVGPHYSVSLDLFDEYNSTFGGTAFIHGLWVDEIFRRRGLASKVLSQVERIAKRAGHNSVFLQWFADTPEYVLEWYKRRGYSIKEEEDGNYALLEKIL